jgi:hypothetical protein
LTKRIVLVLGSAPDAVAVRDWPRGPVTEIVAINNAWALRPDWDYFIHPEDFDPARNPPELTGAEVTAEDYVPIQNDYGGFVYAGGTMAFTAGYWALGALQPDVLAFFGCDMIYDKAGQTHFYGEGTADPLRADVTLRSLEAKSARLMLMAARQGCACVNLSRAKSRLVFPRAALDTLGTVQPAPRKDLLEAALAREAELGYVVPSGRYWLEDARFDPQVIDALDALWLRAVDPA